jgi:hypothetical protein
LIKAGRGRGDLDHTETFIVGLVQGIQPLAKILLIAFQPGSIIAADVRRRV